MPQELGCQTITPLITDTPYTQAINQSAEDAAGNEQAEFLLGTGDSNIFNDTRFLVLTLWVLPKKVGRLRL